MNNENTKFITFSILTPENTAVLPRNTIRKMPFEYLRIVSNCFQISKKQRINCWKAHAYAVYACQMHRYIIFEYLARIAVLFYKI